VTKGNKSKTSSLQAKNSVDLDNSPMHKPPTKQSKTSIETDEPFKDGVKTDDCLSIDEMISKEKTAIKKVSLLSAENKESNTEGNNRDSPPSESSVPAGEADIRVSINSGVSLQGEQHDVEAERSIPFHTTEAVRLASLPSSLLPEDPHFPMENFGAQRMEASAIGSGGLVLPELQKTLLPRLNNVAPRAEGGMRLESGPTEYLQDAWHASFNAPLTQIVSAPEMKRIIAESVILEDNRIWIQNTSAIPYRWLCRLEITAADGTRWLGTGWLASPNLVITAGHCVYLHSHGGWVNDILIQPANAEPGMPTIFRSNISASSSGWVYSMKPECDYGSIFLPKQTEGLGYFGFGALPETTLSQSVANIAGYPMDKPTGTMWGHAKHLMAVLPETLRYENDTYGGMSGAPLIVWNGEDYIVVGIHNYGDYIGNLATRITTKVFHNIVRWRNLLTQMTN